MDWNVARAILKAVSEAENSEPDARGVDQAQVNRHVARCAEAGYMEIQTSAGEPVRVYRLIFKGFEVLEHICQGRYEKLYS